MEILEKLKTALPQQPQLADEEAPPPPRYPANIAQVPSLPPGYDPRQMQAQQAALMQRQAAGQMVEMPGVGMVPRPVYEQVMAQQRLQPRPIQNTPVHAPEKLWTFGLAGIVILGCGGAWFLSYLTSASPSNQMMEIAKLNAQAAVEAAKRPPPSVSVNCLFGCGDAAKEATKSLQQQYQPPYGQPAQPSYPYQAPAPGLPPVPTTPDPYGGQQPIAPVAPPPTAPYQTVGTPSGGYTAQVR